jgi:hypothetical protein
MATPCNPAFDALVARYQAIQSALKLGPNDVPTLTTLNANCLSLLTDCINMRMMLGASPQRQALKRMIRVMHITANQLNTHIQKLIGAPRDNTDGDDQVAGE